jgi:hypothetical protein
MAKATPRTRKKADNHETSAEAASIASAPGRLPEEQALLDAYFNRPRLARPVKFKMGEKRN